MGQTNSNKVSHKLIDLPNTFRDDQLAQILNDIDEEESGKGFSEVFYVVGKPFVLQIITWKDPTKTQKRYQIDFTYTPLPFVSQIVKQVFDQDDDSITRSTLTADIVYNANKSVKSVDVTITRP